jgi:hypothetical protein
MRADGIEENTMPKKDTAAAVIGMLSTVGAQTRRTPEEAEPAREMPAAPSVTVTEDPPAAVSTLPAPVVPVSAPAGEAPRTLRLLPATAQRLREAWLEAKRDDVLLTAQDFASELVDEALVRRRRSRAVNRG